jgi:hypothetical protein
VIRCDLAAEEDDPRVAPAQNCVAARLHFDEMIRVLDPDD